MIDINSQINNLNNSIKDFVAKLYGFDVKIIVLEDRVYNLEKDKLALETKLNDTLSSDMTKTEKINYLQSLLENSDKETEDEKFWNNKYPKANIQYAGRTFGTSKTYIPIDVRLLVTPQDYHIHDILKKNNLYIKDRNYEEGVVKIYDFIKKNFYKYKYDNDNYGVTEYWEFPFEILEGINKDLSTAFDCDSWANFQTSFYIAAGVPNWKVRVVVGGCQLGGHSTVYVHSDVDNKFHHLNSTYGGKINRKKISEFPTTDDAETTDKLGIKNVWFSFNNKYSWNKFTSYANEDFKDNKGDNLYKINVWGIK